MKPLTLKQDPQPEPPKVSIDMAEQIADRAARRAADDVSRENTENFSRFQEQNKQQNQQPLETTQQGKDSIYEDVDGGYSIDTKTEKNLMRRLLDQTLQKALDPPPPSPIENAVNTVMNTVSAGIAEKMLGNLGGGVSTGSKPSFIIDILNSQFGAGLGQNLGANLPGIIQSLSGAIGHQKTQELASAATKAMNQQQTEQQNNGDSSNIEKQKNMVLELDINNPEHISQYAKAMGLTLKAAKGMLQIHQDDILNERKGNVQTNNQQLNNQQNNEITQALTLILQEMGGMKNIINSLQSEIINIKTKKVDENVSVVEPDTDSRWTDENEIYKQPASVTQKSVTLFQTPIKVNLDDIRGNNDPFFNDKSTNDTSRNINANVKENSINRKDVERNVEKEDEVEKESVLEEVVDSEGKSTFKMSGEKEQSKPIIEKIVEKMVEKKPEYLTENTKEEDKKKESNVDESIENEIIGEPNETPKISSKIIRKKIVRTSIPIKKEENINEQDISSQQQTEHYDINNNLMNE